MAAPGDPDSLDHLFEKIKARLASIRANATAPESWKKRTFPSAAESSRQNVVNAAVADALEDTAATLRELADNQRKFIEKQRGDSESFENMKREVGELRAGLASVRDLEKYAAAIEAQLKEVRQAQTELRERSAAFEAELTRWRQEQEEKSKQLTVGHDALGGEMRERIQHLLDEQRVCIRQLTLKNSEEAVLADRARRATELRLDELAQRLGKRAE